MSHTVGLDFGTHQTKVCIQDASNPVQKEYEFLEFKDAFGFKTVLFPSIVQINKDDTVSYGFVDKENCKYVINDKIDEPKWTPNPMPELIVPAEPAKLQYPPKPQPEREKKPLDWKEQLKSLKGVVSQTTKSSLQIWQDECKKIDVENKKLSDKWRECYDKAIKQYEIDQIIREKTNRNSRIEYDKRFKEWEKKRIEKLYFRYFKLSSFSNSVFWIHQISPVIISVWYIAYIIFEIQHKLGKDFFLQMGIPSGINQNIMDMQKKRAFSILIAAYKLVDLYQTKEEYLKETYTNLLEITELDSKLTAEQIRYYGLNVMPEAFAGLSSITQKRSLETGMSILVDIGGGTTDIAFFTIRDLKPDIHSVISFPKGLNYIIEQYINNEKETSVEEAQREFFKSSGNKAIFGRFISDYHKHLYSEVNRMVEKVKTSFECRRDFHMLPTSNLTDALKNRPVIFCGGGAIYKSMQTTVLDFKDIKLINKNILNISHIRNKSIEENLFTILSTSYGLSIPLENEIVLTPLEEAFNHIVSDESKKKDYRYDHGLTDL